MKITILLTLLLSSILSYAQDGLIGEYYSGTNFEQKVMTRIDPKIDFHWRYEAPSKDMPLSYYSIRWTGKILAPETGKYLFSAKMDDGIRLWVNDVPMINAWDLHDMGDFSNSIILEKGKTYTIKVEYFNAMREGEIRLLWQLPSQVNSTTYSYNNFKPVSAQYLYQPNSKPKPLNTPDIASKSVAPPIKKLKTEKPIPKSNTPLMPSASSRQGVTVSTVKEASKPASTFEKMDNNLDIKQVFFIRGINKMTDNSIGRLDKIVDFLKKNQKAEVALHGHTDVMGDAQKNMELSVSRAKVVADYLISKGITDNRIQYQGFGGSKPLFVDPKTEEERALNRRVEFVIQ
jgi:outer membrane protein OmpA-like peptidoglycan-associated protein